MSVFKNRFADKNSSKSNSGAFKAVNDSNQNLNDYEEDIGEYIEGKWVAEKANDYIVLN